MKNLLYLSIFTTFMVLTWIGFGIYHNNTTSTITRDKEIIITPIPATFDQETINKIRLRTVVEADLSSSRKIASGSSSIVEDISPLTPTGIQPTQIPIVEQLPTDSPSGSPAGSIQI